MSRIHRFLLPLLLAITLAVGTISVNTVWGAWSSNGTQTNPVAGQVLADTGPLGAVTSGNFTVLIYADNTSTVEIEHRNALNTVTLDSQTVWLNGYQAVNISVTLLLNERIRVVSNGFTGITQASILN